MATARFCQINLVAHDMKATLAFYRRLGLEIPEAAVWESGGAPHHATMDGSGAVDLEFDIVATGPGACEAGISEIKVTADYRPAHMKDVFDRRAVQAENSARSKPVCT